MTLNLYQTAACRGAAVGKLRLNLSADFKCWQRQYSTFSIWIKPRETCLLVCIVYEAAATRGVLFTCRAKPSIEVVMSGIWCFVHQIELEWKPLPLCPVIESNSGISGFALEIPLNHNV